MKLNAVKFGMAVASVWAAAGLICGVGYKLAPDLYSRTANFLLHTDMYQATRFVGWGELILAVAAWWAISAVLAVAAAAAYNRTLHV